MSQLNIKQNAAAPEEDSQLTPEQVTQFTEAFHTYDWDKDGLLEETGLRQALRAVGVDVTESEAKDIVFELDTISHEMVQLPQFLMFMDRKLQNAASEQELLDACKLFDLKGKGTLMASELRHIMTSLGERLTEEEADELIREADIDGDGEIDCNELASMMLAKG